jgi:hypothetical protein
MQQRIREWLTTHLDVFLLWRGIEVASQICDVLCLCGHFDTAILDFGGVAKKGLAPSSSPAFPESFREALLQNLFLHRPRKFEVFHNAGQFRLL